MRVKIDEDLPLAVKYLLLQHGHDAQTVYEQGMSGWKDADIFSVIQTEKRFFITGDKGFGDLRIYPLGTHPGILILRPSRPSVSAFVHLLEQVIEAYRLEEFKGCLVVVSPRGIRVRRPPR